MTTLIRRPRIGFDVGPGQSGPGRYVDALKRGIDPQEFDVVILSSPNAAQCRGSEGAAVNADCAPIASADAPPNKTAITSSRMPIVFRWASRRFAPRTLSLWAGYLRTAKRQAKSLCNADLDLVHLQNTGCEEAPLAARMARVPAVLGTLHVDSTYDLEQARSGLGHRVLEHVSNHCLHLAIAVSDATKRDWLRRTHLPGQRVITIHNGVDPDRFQRRHGKAEARKRLGLPDDGCLIVGGAGRLDLAKGFRYLIDAAALLATDFPQLTIAIAGTGALQGELEARAVELGVANRVRFLGYLSDVSLLYDAIDLFALPSLCETIGYVVLEAMAHELPVVGTSVGGVPEVIVAGETGFVVPPRSSAELARAVRELLESSDARRRMGLAGRQRVVRCFQERDSVRRTIELYRKMLRMSSRR